MVSRGTGRSAVAASAYLSCSKILNDYDGVQHDYTRKKGLVCRQGLDRATHHSRGCGCPRVGEKGYHL
ncbi:MobA/MobL family protein [Intestinimonas massiliensis]|uniref:MobA/MobL family protein n=1 Tax=Intestinimonas massiliensis (ex Afouda et al. 2020) TaxID=1673721 RepID=UPI00210A98C5|nr:MobA/MobL family protein [Intestinimonas massiliensis (ex Afouda et al. 2020)]